MVRIGPSGGGGTSGSGDETTDETSASSSGSGSSTTDVFREVVEEQQSGTAEQGAEETASDPNLPSAPDPLDPEPTRTEQTARDAVDQQQSGTAEQAAEETASEPTGDRTTDTQRRAVEQQQSGAGPEGGADATRTRDTQQRAVNAQRATTTEAAAREQGELRQAAAEQTGLSGSDIQFVEQTGTDTNLYWDDQANELRTAQRGEFGIETTREFQSRQARQQFQQRRQQGERTAAMSRLGREDTVPLSQFDSDELAFATTDSGATVRPTEQAARQQARQQAADEFGVDESEVSISETDDGFRATVAGAGAAGATARTREQSFLDRATGGLTETAREEGLTPEPGQQEEFIGGLLDDIGLTTPSEEDVTGAARDRATGAAETIQDLNDQFSAGGLGFGDSFEETGADVEQAAPAALGLGAEAVETAGDINDRFSADGLGFGDSFQETGADVEQATPTDAEGAAETVQDLNSQFSAGGLGFGDSFGATAEDVEAAAPAAVDAGRTAAETAAGVNDRLSADGVGFTGSGAATAEDVEQQAPAAIDAGRTAAETVAAANDRFSVESGGFVGSFGATADDVEERLPASGDAAVEQAPELYDRFSVEGGGFGVQRVDEDGDPVTTDRDTDGLAGAAAVGVAAPEPTTTIGGAAVLGALAVGGVAFDTARRRGMFEDDGELEPAPPDTQQQELEIGEFGSAELEVGEQDTAELEVGGEVVTGSELEPSDAGFESEIDIGGGSNETGGGGTGGETVVPGEYPLPGRDIPTDPTQESGRETQPEDILDDTFGTAPAGQQQTGQQRQEEEDPLDELLRDFEETQQRRRRERARAREQELGGAEEAISRRRQRQQRAQRLPLVNSGEDTFGFGREFPTGASAVVGREVARGQQAQQQQIGQQVGQGTETGLFEDVLGGLDVGVGQQPAVLQEQRTGQQPQQGLFTAPAVAQRTLPEQLFESETFTQQQTEFVNPTETVTEDIFETGPGAGGFGTFERPSRPRSPDRSDDDRDEEDYLFGEEDALFGSGIASGAEAADDLFDLDEEDFL